MAEKNCTSYKDKNNNFICDGDTVNITVFDGKFDFNVTVNFNRDKLCFELIPEEKSNVQRDINWLKNSEDLLIVKNL